MNQFTLINCQTIPLREKCPNTEWFLVRIFLYSYWIRRFTSQIYEVNLRIQSEYRKIRTRNNSVFGHFPCSVHFIQSHHLRNVSVKTIDDVETYVQQQDLFLRISTHNLLTKYFNDDTISDSDHEKFINTAFCLLSWKLTIYIQKNVLWRWFVLETCTMDLLFWT